MTLFGLFSQSKHAGEAVSELHQEGFTKDISIVAKDDKTGDLSHEQVKSDITDGVTAGAVAGGIFGLVAGALTLAPVAVAGLLIGGPLVSLLGTATGAVTGGILGGLIDAGIPEERARLFEERINAGEVLVAVTAASERIPTVETIFTHHGAEEMTKVEV